MVRRRRVIVGGGEAHGDDGRGSAVVRRTEVSVTLSFSASSNTSNASNASSLVFSMPAT